MLDKLATPPQDRLKNSWFSTPRLALNPIALPDKDFMLELLNTPDWLKFIGDRNVKTREHAQAYIQEIITNEKKNYWVVRLSDSRTSIGLISLIQRDYLAYQDIGFAFLPNYYGQGYAYEASQVILNFARHQLQIPHIQAITDLDNLNSIKLLEKLGFQFLQLIMPSQQELRLYDLKLNA
jgi:[ribosomal protein S5]-alanine N-acetyltransferase